MCTREIRVVYSDIYMKNFYKKFFIIFRNYLLCQCGIGGKSFDCQMWYGGGKNMSTLLYVLFVVCQSRRIPIIY